MTDVATALRRAEELLRRAAKVVATSPETPMFAAELTAAADEMAALPPTQADVERMEETPDDVANRVTDAILLDFQRKGGLSAIMETANYFPRIRSTIWLRIHEFAKSALSLTRPAGGEEVEEALDRSPAQFFFEVGYGACWAEACVRNGKGPFELTDALVERAWEIAGEAHDDPAEFDRYLALTKPPALPKEGEELIIETLARLEEVHGNKAGAFTLRNVGILGTVFEQRAAVLREALSSLPVRSGEVERLRDALDAVLASSGARGRYHALEYADAVERAEALLAADRAALATPQQVKEGDR